MTDTSSAAKAKVETVLKHFRVPDAVLLGSGGEGYVYEYKGSALKIYTHNLGLDYVENIRNLQLILAQHNFTFQTPQILDCGEINGVVYSIEKKLVGIPMDRKILTLNTEDRKKLYQQYYDAISQIHTITFADHDYGQIIDSPERTTASSWESYLQQKLLFKVEKTRNRLAPLIPDYDEKVDRFQKLVLPHLNSDLKCLIHSDYYLNNVLVNDNNKLTAILDFSVHAAVGDPRFDIASVLTWNEISPDVHKEDYSFLYEKVQQDIGGDVDKWSAGYLLFSSFYYGDMDDPGFTIRNLSNQDLWNRF